MRKIPSSGAASVAMAEFNIHSLSPQQSAPETPPCDANKCPWWPYTSSKEFKADTALIIVVLFCALICALAFNAAVRYVIRLHCNRRRRNRKDGFPAEMSVEIPALVYSEGMKLAGAESSECIICLSEFSVGEKIRVLDKCNHGFHLHCIQRWLVCHSSCPTCRANCYDESKSSPPP